MDFEFSSAQEMLRESVRRFVAEQAPIGPYVRGMLDDPRGTTDAVWRGLAEIGALGLLVPEEHGGAGGGMVDAAVVLEELGRVVHPGPFTSTAVGAASLVARGGTDADRAALLPGLAAGELVATVALDEPGRRGAWRSPTTTARVDGEGWRVDGEKVHVPDAPGADVLLLTAAAPDVGIAVFAVDRNERGLTVEATPTVDGTRKEATITLAGARARRIGTGDLAPVVAEVVDRLLVAWVVDGVGAAEQAMAMAVDYAKDRKQFDRPIGSFQAVQHLCADMLQLVELGRAAAYYACWACDAADQSERHRATTMATAFARDAFYRVGANAIQVFGGIGFTWEHDVHLFYKRLLSLQQAWGTTADDLEELASLILD